MGFLIRTYQETDKGRVYWTAEVVRAPRIHTSLIGRKVRSFSADTAYRKMRREIIGRVGWV